MFNKRSNMYCTYIYVGAFSVDHSIMNKKRHVPGCVCTIIHQVTQTAKYTSNTSINKWKTIKFLMEQHIVIHTYAPLRSLSVDCNLASAKRIALLCLLLNSSVSFGNDRMRGRVDYVIDCDLPHRFYGQFSGKLSARIRYSLAVYVCHSWAQQRQPQENHKIHLHMCILIVISNHRFFRSADNFMLALMDASKSHIVPP